MATLYNTVTKTLLRSANTPLIVPTWTKAQGSVVIGDWIVNPDLSAVTSVAPRYWKPSGTALVEMTAQEKAAVDAAIAAAADAARVAGATARYDARDLDRAILFVTLDEINALRQAIVARDNVVAGASSLANLKTAWGALPTLPDRTKTQLRNAILSTLSAMNGS